MTKIQNPKCEYDLKKERFNSMYCFLHKMQRNNN